MKNFFGPIVKNCCILEKGRLVDALMACDYCTESIEERHSCYRETAKESGRRARACIAVPLIKRM
jgi:hypothetical protein